MDVREHLGEGIMKKHSSLATTAVRRAGDVVTRANLNTRLRVRCSLRALALLDLSGHGQECLLDIRGVLSRGLKEGDAQAVSEFLNHVLANITEGELIFGRCF
jgi:hypothetical protein